jgi:hypothetical protein
MHRGGIDEATVDRCHVGQAGRKGWDGLPEGEFSEEAFQV